MCVEADSLKLRFAGLPVSSVSFSEDITYAEMSNLLRAMLMLLFVPSIFYPSNTPHWHRIERYLSPLTTPLSSLASGTSVHSISCGVVVVVVESLGVVEFTLHRGRRCSFVVMYARNAELNNQSLLSEGEVRL